MGQRRFAEAPDFRVPAHASGRSILSSNNVLLVIADKILKQVANYIYIPIYSTISRIPTTLRYSPLLLVTENGKVEIITTDQSDAAFGLNPVEVSGFCKSLLANSLHVLYRAQTHQVSFKSLNHMQGPDHLETSGTL